MNNKIKKQIEKEFLKITINQYSTSTTATAFISLSKIQNAIKQTGNTLKLFFYSGGLLSISIIFSFLAGKLKFNKKIKQEEKRIRKETHQNNAISVVSQMVKPDGSLPSVNDINSMMGNDDLSQDFAKAYSKATTSSKLTREKAEFDDTGFQSYAMDVFDSKDSEQIQQAIINTLNGGGDGRVNQDEVGYIITAFYDERKELKW